MRICTSSPPTDRCMISRTVCRSSRRAGSPGVSGAAAHVVTHGVEIGFCAKPAVVATSRSSHSDFTAPFYPLCRDAILSACHLKLDIDVHLAPPAINRHFHRVSRFVAVHHMRQVLRIAHILSVDGHDQIAAKNNWAHADVGPLVAASQSGLLCGTATLHALDEQTTVVR